MVEDLTASGMGAKKATFAEDILNAKSDVIEKAKGDGDVEDLD